MQIVVVAMEFPRTADSHNKLHSAAPRQPQIAMKNTVNDGDKMPKNGGEKMSLSSSPKIKMLHSSF